MKERPIIFQGWGVRAIQAEVKTQTRRIAKFKPLRAEEGLDVLAPTLKLGTYMTGHPETGYVLYSMRGGCWNQVTKRLFCPYGVPGDRLWVRETWAPHHSGIEYLPVHYRADFLTNPAEALVGNSTFAAMHWKPSIHMARQSSRLLLEITEIRLQRVQEINEEDAKAEGVELVPCPNPTAFHSQACPNGSYRLTFAVKWEAINAKLGFGWSVNPWVWCLTFRRVSAP